MLLQRRMSAPKFTHPNKISTLRFYVLGTEENQDDSNVDITHKETFKSDFPIQEGPYDSHMGTTDHAWNCTTCANKKTKCDGHYGSIDLKYPAKNPMFRDQLLKYLKIICFNCGELIVTKKISSDIPKEKRISEYVKLARNESICPRCKTPHPTVTKNKLEPGMFQIELKGDASFDFGLGEGVGIGSRSGTQYNTKTASKSGSKQARVFKKEKKMELFNHEIYNIINRISNETVLKIGKPLVSHPKKFILWTIRVLPNTARPDSRSIGGNRSSNTDITAFLKNIVEQNEALPTKIPARQNITEALRDIYYSIDALVFAMIKGNTASSNQVRLATSTYKQPNSIANRLPKKTGRFRRNILGKRCRYMIRSVITGDNYIRVDEVGIPVVVAMDMSIPEVVTDDNMDTMNIYYRNGSDIYPGCKGIIKKKEGHLYNVKYIDTEYKLQVGDTVLRHMLDGDVINLNRAPSLTFSSISCHYVKILFKSDTIKMNVSVCSLYNADFDGDCMNAIVARDIMSRNEISKLAHVGQWFVSYQNGTPLIGAFQDSLIGMAELTRGDVVFDKWHAMNMFSNVDLSNVVFDKKSYTSRDIVSMILPQINVRKKKPTFYMPQYAGMLKYRPEDISVTIDRGRLMSGILDNNTIGQGVQGSIFHVICNEYGARKALDTVFNVHQITGRYFLWKGFTVSIKDIIISDSARREIDMHRQKMFVRSSEVTKKLDEGKLIFPIGTTLEDYYEDEQRNALQAADDFIEPIYNDIDFDNNGLAKLVMFGSKGKSSHMISINADVGQPIIGGRRPTAHFAWGRTSPFTFRYDPTPRAMGYISTSYKEGMDPDIYAFTCGEARDALISNALSTSVPGYQTRLGVRCLETIVANNNRSSSKPQSLIQPIYAESGVDPRRAERVKFPSVMINDAEFDSLYKPTTDLKMFEPMYRSADVKKILQGEYVKIKEDRAEFRELFIGLADNDPGGKVYFASHYQMPVNIHRVLANTLYNYRDEVNQMKAHEKRLDPVRVVEKVSELCTSIDYAYFNNNWEKQKGPIPDHIKAATYMFKILIRSTLCSKQLALMGMNDALLDIALVQIKTIYKKSLIDYGSAVGIIAAQCVSEPMTQYVLNSKHRSGVGGTKTKVMDRVREILGARPTEKMKNPTMILMTDKKHENNRMKVQEIANHIEMMDLERFLRSSRIFFEEYGNPVHEKFSHESKMIKHFEKYTNMVPPNDLAKWCIRFELIREELLINSMKLETIINVLNTKYPNLHIVYTPENSNKLIIRCYLRYNMIKIGANQTVETAIIGIMWKIRSTVIRGLKGIKYANVIEITRPYVQDDGSVKTGSIFGIETVGSNMEAVIQNPYIDIYRSQCDSVIEFEDIYGIGAARNKVINEMIKTMEGLDRTHATMYADEMCFSGQVTSIQKSGMQKREMANVALRIGFQSPVQVAEDAALNGYVSQVHGVSGPLVVGGVIATGTRYNDIIVCEKFVEEYNKNLMGKIEDEL